MSGYVWHPILQSPMVSPLFLPCWFILRQGAFHGLREGALLHEPGNVIKDMWDPKCENVRTGSFWKASEARSWSSVARSSQAECWTYKFIQTPHWLHIHKKRCNINILQYQTGLTANTFSYSMRPPPIHHWNVLARIKLNPFRQCLVPGTDNIQSLRIQWVQCWRRLHSPQCSQNYHMLCLSRSSRNHKV